MPIPNENTALHEFKARHQLKKSDLRAIFCVTDPTIRKYLAPNGSSMFRKLNPIAGQIIALINDKSLSTQWPAIKQWPEWNAEEFDSACGDRSNIEVGAALATDRATVYRWRTGDLPVPAMAAKAVMLFNLFGWPKPGGLKKA